MSAEALVRVAGLVAAQRLPLHSEKATQAALEQALQKHGAPFEREVALGDADVVDFLVDGVAIELKLKGSPMAIFRQLRRYSEHDKVKALLLLTARAMHLPSSINGKPAAVASLGAAWL